MDDVENAPVDQLVRRTWVVHRLSVLGNILPLSQVGVGFGLIGVGVGLLITDWGSYQRLGFVWLIFVGCVGLAAGHVLLNVVVKKVEAMADGKYRFSSRRRSLTIDPRDIRSMQGLGTFMDFWGAYPFQIKTRSGSILVDRHMRDAGNLERELLQANPRIVVKRAWGETDRHRGVWG